MPALTHLPHGKALSQRTFLCAHVVQLRGFSEFWLGPGCDGPVLMAAGDMPLGIAMVSELTLAGKCRFVLLLGWSGCCRRSWRCEIGLGSEARNAPELPNLSDRG